MQRSCQQIATDISLICFAVSILFGCSRSADVEVLNKLELQLKQINARLQVQVTTERDVIEAEAELLNLVAQSRLLNEQNAALLLRSNELRVQRDKLSLAGERRKRLLEERIQLLEWDKNRDSYRRKLGCGIIEYREVPKRTNEMREFAFQTSNHRLALLIIEENRMLLERLLEECLKVKMLSTMIDDVKLKLRQTQEDLVAIEQVGAEK